MKVKERFSKFSGLDRIKISLLISTGFVGAHFSATAQSYPSYIEPFLRGHLHNITQTFSTYFILTALFYIKPKLKAVMLFSILIIGEFCQLFGLYRGTFDPVDILCYAAGICLALLA